MITCWYIYAFTTLINIVVDYSGKRRNWKLQQQAPVPTAAEITAVYTRSNNNIPLFNFEPVVRRAKGRKKIGNNNSIYCIAEKHAHAALVLWNVEKCLARTQRDWDVGCSFCWEMLAAPIHHHQDKMPNYRDSHNQVKKLKQKQASWHVDEGERIFFSLQRYKNWGKLDFAWNVISTFQFDERIRERNNYHIQPGK